MEDLRLRYRLTQALATYILVLYLSGEVVG